MIGFTLVPEKLKGNKYNIERLSRFNVVMLHLHLEIS